MRLQKEGVGIKMDSVLPHLVLVDDDLLSTGIVVYHLKVRHDSPAKIEPCGTQGTPQSKKIITRNHYAVYPP